MESHIRFNIKHLLIATAMLALLIALLMPIRGMFPPFYYEEFNGVKRRLEAVPDLVINSFWQHKDVVLEDCGFDVTVDNANARLTFVDHQDWVGLFDHVDGIRFHSNGKQYFVTSQQLRHHGLDVAGLTDILKNLDGVLSYCLNATSSEFDKNKEFSSNFRSFSRWISIRESDN